MHRQYGAGPLDIYQYQSATVNFDTGGQTKPATKTRVRRAVVLPATVAAKVVSTISKNSQFQTSTRVFLIDQSLAPGLDLSTDDWLVYRDRRYNVAQFTEFEWDALWVVVASEVRGETPLQIIDVHATTAMRLDDAAS